MRIIGVDYLNPLLDEGGISAKMVFNATGALFFPISQEHRDQKSDGISYEDDYRGNALAAILTPGKIDIRWHKSFSDSRVAEIIGALRNHPELSCLKNWTVLYQGRNVTAQTGE